LRISSKQAIKKMKCVQLSILQDRQHFNLYICIKANIYDIYIVAELPLLDPSMRLKMMSAAWVYHLWVAPGLDYLLVVKRGAEYNWAAAHRQSYDQQQSVFESFQSLMLD